MKKIFVVFWSMMLTMSIIFAESIGFYQGNGKIGHSSSTPGDSVYAQKHREKAETAEQKPAKFFTVPLGTSLNELVKMRRDVEKFDERVEYPVENERSLKQYSSTCNQQGVRYRKTYSFMDDKLYSAGIIMPYNTDKEKEVVGYMMTAFREQCGVPVEKIIAYDDKLKIISRSENVEQYLMATAT